MNKQQLLDENLKLKQTLNAQAISANQVNEGINSIKDNYVFFKSQVPNSTAILGDGTTVVFEANSRITGRDKNTGKVVDQEVWGQYYTKSPEIIQELDRACRTNSKISRMDESEVNYVLDSIRTSHSLN